MKPPTQEQVAEARKAYPEGTRIELIKFDDPYSKLGTGSRGTVKFVDDALGIHTAWDNGERLACLIGVDEFVIITD